MDIRRFDSFSTQCCEKLGGAIEEILGSGNSAEEKVRAIGFVTTDDFYGFYLTWSSDSSCIEEYYDWEQSLEPEFLYQPLVDIVDGCTDIDLLNKSDEKWDFALTLLKVLADSISGLPEEVFAKNGYKREDIVFFAAMASGDYVEELLTQSLGMFNPSQKAE
ncbi:MAG: hypothetical protein IJO91_04700 [Oscillospiraceae bacterium]|nr:hypothetical protein [Oscillospiraceae bacterium]